MDALAKALERIVKYAWGVFAAACVVLFLPDGTARDIGLYDFRLNANDFLWTLVALAAAFALAPVLADARQNAIVQWLKGWQDRKMRRAYRRKRREALALALSGLNAGERMWIKYCLYHNTRTLTAECNHPIAQELYRKGIIEEGSGHILDLPFHIPTDVWHYLLAHKRDFIAEHDMRDESLRALLETFRKSLRSPS